MNCQILFSGKNKKNITNLSSAELAHRVVMVNLICIQNSYALVLFYNSWHFHIY